MPTRFVKGDLFHYPGLQALAHGCNCAGSMGKGIATTFRDRFPEMHEEYRRRCGAGAFGLGDVFVWRQEPLTIFNLGTQKTWRTKARLSAIEQSVLEMVRVASERRISTIGLPRIGAGYGGLEWQQVKSVLSRIGDASSVELVVFEEFVAETDD